MLNPLDGRYAERCPSAHAAFSESEITRLRIEFELEWFVFIITRFHSERVPLASLEQFLVDVRERLRDDMPACMAEVAQLELRTRHDVKAVEYWVKAELERHGELLPFFEYVHILLTSEDTCTYATEQSCRNYTAHLWETYSRLARRMRALMQEEAGTSILGRTHGQPASPTTVGKEVANLYRRLEEYGRTISEYRPSVKISGATGNFNAHRVVFPNEDWIELAKQFAERLGGHACLYATQVSPKDNVIQLIDSFVNQSMLMRNFAKNCWMYVSNGELMMPRVPGEVGSSTMPHKVNPIAFENAEGNFLMAEGVFHTIKSKLFESRYQRDLSDSTVLRNLGVAFGYFEVALNALADGLERVVVNEVLINDELANHYEVLLEPIQQALRRDGVAGAYERVAAEFQGRLGMSRVEYVQVIDRLPLSDADRYNFKQMSPWNYTGFAAELARRALFEQ